MSLKLKHGNIGETPTKEDIEKEIARLDQIKTDHRNADAALKIIINSIYGVLGYTRFVCYHRDVAESVTKQSVDVIQYTERVINEYFNEIWHKDTEVHEMLGLTKVKKISVPIVKYMDTDSVFLDMHTVFKSCDYKGDLVDFCLQFHSKKFNQYMAQKLRNYTESFGAAMKKFNGKDSFILELEQIAESILWVAKKKYIKHLAWYKNVRYDRLDKISIVGLQTKVSSFPKFARDNLKNLITYLVDTNGNPNRGELSKKLDSLRKQFETLPVDDICLVMKCSNYENYVVSHDKSLEFAPRAGEQHRAAAYFNHILYHSDYKERYEFIKSGDRVKFYYTQDAQIDVFGFLPGKYPMELNPPSVNYNAQFAKVLLDPLNNIIEALGMQRIDQSLTVFPSL